MDLSKLSLDGLKDLLQKARKEESDREKFELEAARNEIYAIAHRLKVPLIDIIGAGISKPVRKVAVQYCNPDNEEQKWTGRGRQPKWVKELLASGEDLQMAKVKT